jgi:hypothetical protein
MVESVERYLARNVGRHASRRQESAIVSRAPPAAANALVTRGSPPLFSHAHRRARHCRGGITTDGPIHAPIGTSALRLHQRQLKLAAEFTSPEPL